MDGLEEKCGWVQHGLGSCLAGASSAVLVSVARTCFVRCFRLGSKSFTALSSSSTRVPLGFLTVTSSAICCGFLRFSPLEFLCLVLFNIDGGFFRSLAEHRWVSLSTAVALVVLFRCLLKTSGLLLDFGWFCASPR